MRYADVILPVPLHATFTYAISEGMVVEEGVRVLVPFGRGTKYVGLVCRSIRVTMFANMKSYH